MEWVILIVGALIFVRIWLAQLWIGKSTRGSIQEVLSRMPPPPEPPKPLKKVSPNNYRYPLSSDQSAQIDCRNSLCRFHECGTCVNVSPAITISGSMVTCWTELAKPDNVEGTVNCDKCNNRGWVIEPKIDRLGDMRLCTCWKERIKKRRNK